MRGFATHPIEFMPKLLLILRFYRSAMLFFCGAVSVALAWLVTGYGPSVVPLCLAGKMVIYPVYLYVWIIPRYNDYGHEIEMYTVEQGEKRDKRQ